MNGRLFHFVYAYKALATLHNNHNIYDIYDTERII